MLRRAADGDQAAWAELVLRYAPLLRRRTARFRLQDADALDAAQLTWLRLAERASTIRSLEHLAGWLATTTVGRECLRIARHNRRMLSSDDVLDRLPDAAPGPEQAVVDAHVADSVRAAVTSSARCGGDSSRNCSPTGVDIGHIGLIENAAGRRLGRWPAGQ